MGLWFQGWLRRSREIGGWSRLERSAVSRVGERNCTTYGRLAAWSLLGLMVRTRAIYPELGEITRHEHLDPRDVLVGEFARASDIDKTDSGTSDDRLDVNASSPGGPFHRVRHGEGLADEAGVGMAVSLIGKALAVSHISICESLRLHWVR